MRDQTEPTHAGRVHRGRACSLSEKIPAFAPAQWPECSSVRLISGHEVVFSFFFFTSIDLTPSAFFSSSSL